MHGKGPHAVTVKARTASSDGVAESERMALKVFLPRAELEALQKRHGESGSSVQQLRAVAEAIGRACRVPQNSLYVRRRFLTSNERAVIGSCC
jgi:hypothetical protein